MEDRNRCGNCGRLLLEGEQFCRSCGSAADASLPDEQVMSIDLRERPSSCSTRLAAGCLIAIVILLGVVGLMAEHFRQGKKKARLKACVANMRVIEGAIDMWEMDQPLVSDMTMSGGVVFERDGVHGPVGGRIVGTYIKKACRCREGGAYLYDGDSHTVSCTLHGTVDEPRIP